MSASPLSPVRPRDPVDADEADEGDPVFEHPDDAGVEVAKVDPRIDTDETVCGPFADAESIVKPQLLPSPKAPECCRGLTSQCQPLAV